MSARDRLLISIVVSIAAVVAAWMLIVAPKRQEAARLGARISAAQAQLRSAASQAAVAIADRRAYAANYAAVARLGEAVPTDDDTGSLIYQLQAAASGSGVAFQSLVLNASTSASPAPSSSSGASSALAAQLPPGASVGPAGFPTMPFTFTFQGNFFHLSSFFARLQRFVTATARGIQVRGRLMTLNAISLGPGAGGFPRIVATISATTYLLPAGQGLTAGATPAGPSGTAATVPASSTTGAGATSTPTAAVTP
jgi:hypothetical protein